MADKQQTIRSRASLTGVGLHSGETVTVTFCPAPINHGIIFKRTDLEGQPLIPADVDLVSDTARGTTLSLNGVKISTVEHALAAAGGLQIDNLLIEVSGVEIPILDGSAQFFLKAIKDAGIEVQDADREYYELKTNVFYNDPSRNVEIIAVPSED
jgi:UDP-3-O-[3-hydroxymyristoyl] N-acetylglucosamine deacetylase/3-hydroxyacyl-[acyl-carrier-protein] dehydratase